MFQRRSPLPIHARLRDSLWPRKGWHRASLYIGHRLGRLPGTPYGVAAGFACGAAISFTPFLGLHFVGAALLSLILRCNVIASIIGTMVGNLWTFPFIWAWIYGFGRWLLGRERSYELSEGLNLHYLFQNPVDVLWPMTVGGIPTAVVAWFAFFVPLYIVIEQYQRARRWRIRKRIAHMRERTKGAKLAGKI